MLDVQSSEDFRQIPITKVGITKVNHPIVFYDEPSLLADESSESQKTFPYGPQAYPTVGVFSLFAYLDADKKGTHMSRFLSVLYEHAPHLSFEKMNAFALDITKVLETSRAYVEAEFPFFYEKSAPVSKIKGMTDVSVKISVQADVSQNPNCQVELVVAVPIKSLCPCSKAISEFGAHSQRGIITMTIKNPSLTIAQCIEIADASASCPIYPVLKRADEKYVTETAYQNPRFVEDLVREAAVRLKEAGEVSFEVTAENFESIHNHNAYAVVSHF